MNINLHERQTVHRAMREVAEGIGEPAVTFCRFVTQSEFKKALNDGVNLLDQVNSEGEVLVVCSAHMYSPSLTEIEDLAYEAWDESLGDRRATDYRDWMKRELDVSGQPFNASDRFLEGKK